MEIAAGHWCWTFQFPNLLDVMAISMRCRNKNFGRHVTRNMPCWIDRNGTVLVSTFFWLEGFFLMFGQFWQFFFDMELLFSLLDSFCALFIRFITTFFCFGEFGAFCHLLTFVTLFSTFWCLDNFDGFSL